MASQSKSRRGTGAVATDRDGRDLPWERHMRPANPSQPPLYAMRRGPDKPQPHFSPVQPNMTGLSPSTQTQTQPLSTKVLRTCMVMEAHTSASSAATQPAVWRAMAVLSRPSIDLHVCVGSVQWVVGGD